MFQFVQTEAFNDTDLWTFDLSVCEQNLMLEQTESSTYDIFFNQKSINPLSTKQNL